MLLKIFQQRAPYFAADFEKISSGGSGSGGVAADCMRKELDMLVFLMHVYKGDIERVRQMSDEQPNLIKDCGMFNGPVRCFSNLLPFWLRAGIWSGMFASYPPQLWSALHVAAFAGQLDVMRLLI